MPQGNGCKKHKVCIRYNRIRVPRGYVFQPFGTPISIEVKRRKNRGDRLSHIANIEEFRVIGYYISEVSDIAHQSGEKLFSEYGQKQKYYPCRNEVTHKEKALTRENIARNSQDA